LVGSTVCSVIAGLDPAIHSFCREMDHRVTALRARPVMTTPDEACII
jgi:hypothetical protein